MNFILIFRQFRSLSLLGAVLAPVLLCSCALFSEPEHQPPPLLMPDRGQSEAPSRAPNPKAEATFAKARALWRPDGRGLSAEQCADPARALELLDEALVTDPRYAEAYVYRGLAKSELSMREEAFDDLTQAILLSPRPANYAYRALVSFRAGQDTAARRDLEYSLKLAPGQAQAYNYLGILALAEEEKPEACAAFAKACANGDCVFIEAARREKICR